MPPSALRHVQVDGGGSARCRLSVLVHSAGARGIFTEHVQESRACDTRGRVGVYMCPYSFKREEEEGEE